MLEQRGYRVIALDLPGTGCRHARRTSTWARQWMPWSPPRRTSTRSAPELAIGHSYGGTVLAAGIDCIAPTRAIYVDSPFTSRGGWDCAETTAEYTASKVSRTYERLRERRPLYSERDYEDWTPSAPPASLMVRARPSKYISDEITARLRANGLDVRDIPGAAHSVWYSYFDEFLAAIDDHL